MKKVENLILGAGASGAICAITLKERGKDVLVIDNRTKLAKKILETGNGRCNLTNENMSSDFYNQNIDKYLARFDKTATLDFFESLGLLTCSDEQGRIYPISNSARSVLDVFANRFENLDIQTELETKVERIEKSKDGFVIKTDKGDFACKNLVCAMGGNSLDVFSDNIKIQKKPSKPSLVSLKAKISNGLANVKVSNVNVSVKDKNQKIKTEFGEVLFKSNGLSGICIFNLSSIFARGVNFDNHISIDLLPNMRIEQVEEMLVARKKLPVKINHFFDGLFVREIGWEILNRNKMDESRFASELSNFEIKNLAKTIKNLDFIIDGVLDNNQVFSGGVLLEGLSDNLESKTEKGLYFAGEVCDVDGVCGGYNLQWAWTSGRIVGESI